MPKIYDVWTGELEEICSLAEKHGHEADMCLMRFSIFQHMRSSDGYDIDKCADVAELFLLRTRPIG